MSETWPHRAYAWMGNFPDGDVRCCHCGRIPAEHDGEPMNWVCRAGQDREGLKEIEVRAKQFRSNVWGEQSSNLNALSLADAPDPELSRLKEEVVKAAKDWYNAGTFNDWHSTTEGARLMDAVDALAAFEDKDKND